MSLDHLFPSAGDNAIQSAVFAVEWPVGPPASNGAQGDRNITKIRDAAKNALKDEFAHCEDMAEFTMSVGPGGVTHSASPHPVMNGFVLQKKLNDGSIKRSISVFPDKVLIQINDYTRWAEIRSDVHRYFLAITDFLKTKPVAAIGLQFADVFSWKSNPEELNLSEVFREGCKMIPPNVLELDNLWHSHHGYITSKLTPMRGDQLDNVNISRVIQDGVHAVQIVCAHRLSFYESFFMNEVAKIGDVMSAYDALHSDNKAVVEGVLSDEVLAKLKDFVAVHK